MISRSPSRRRSPGSSAAPGSRAAASSSSAVAAGHVAAHLHAHGLRRQRLRHLARDDPARAKERARASDSVVASLGTGPAPGAATPSSVLARSSRILPVGPRTLRRFFSRVHAALLSGWRARLRLHGVRPSTERTTPRSSPERTGPWRLARSFNESRKRLTRSMTMTRRTARGARRSSETHHVRIYDRRGMRKHARTVRLHRRHAPRVRPSWAAAGRRRGDRPQARTVIIAFHEERRVRIRASRRRQRNRYHRSDAKARLVFDAVHGRRDDDSRTCARRWHRDARRPRRSCAST